MGRADGLRVEFEVRDQGAGFDPALVPDPTDPARLQALMEQNAPALVRGRGLWMVRRYARRVEHFQGGRHVRLEIVRRSRRLSEASSWSGADLTMPS